MAAAASDDLIRERLAAARIVAPRREAVVIDLAGDPPLGASAAAIAVEETPRIVAALGAAMIAARARRGVIAVRGRVAERAVVAALDGARAKAARVARVAAVWPSLGVDRDVGCAGAWRLDGESALDIAAAAFAQPRAPRRVTVAGEVRRPGVVRDPRSIAEAVAAAGGSALPVWLALDGGAPGGRLAEPDAAVTSSLLLVLPSAHALVASARVSIADWLRRAASACEGCRQCSDVCPVALDGTPLAPHQLIATLVSGRDDHTRLATAAACTGCGVCDAICPQALSPRALTAHVAARLAGVVPPARRGPAHPDRPGRRVGIERLVMRLGLADYVSSGAGGS